MRARIAILFIVFLIVSCKDGTQEGPVKIHYGEDVCDRCKMIISEERFSAQYILPKGESRKFDDIGCMMLYTAKGEAGAGEAGDISAYYVKDYNSGGWIDGGGAYYVMSKNIRTPMGYGIAALRDEAQAGVLAGHEDGGVLGFDQAASELSNGKSDK